MMSNEKFTAYKSLNPQTIGRSSWRYAHGIAIALPQPGTEDHAKRKQFFIDFANAICETFPCSVCRDHCKLPYSAEEAVEDFQKFNHLFLILHNRVRVQQKRKELTPQDVETFVLTNVLPEETSIKVRASNASDDSNEDLYFWIMISLAIVLTISIVIHVIQQKKCNKKK
jgi:hypothetical protein